MASWLKRLLGTGSAQPNTAATESTYVITVSDLQGSPISGHGHSDLFKGLKFCATMQLRTPLRVLLRHQELYDGPDSPPAIAHETWEGVWTPYLKTYRELGIDIDDFQPTTMASSIGPIPADGGEFLQFLLSVREIVEKVTPIENRRLELKSELMKESWKKYVRKLGGAKAIADSFFPKFIETLPGLTPDSRAGLWERKLTTPKAINSTSDADLRKIKGIGPAKLKKIRQYCETALEPDGELVDNVKR